MPRTVPALAAALGVALALGQPGAARAEDALSRARTSGALVVGAAAPGAPFDDVVNGRHVGFDADLLDAIGTEIGLGIRWDAPSAIGGSEGVGRGEASMMAGPVVLTAAVLSRYRALPPVIDVSEALLKRRGDGSLLKPAEIAGKTLGAVKASPALAALRTYAKGLPARVVVRDHAVAADVRADLAAGRVAAVAGGLPFLALMAKDNPDTFEVVQPPFGPRTYLGFVVARDADHAALAEAVAAAILKLRADGRLAALQVKWFGMAFDTPDAVPDPRP